MLEEKKQEKKTEKEKIEKKEIDSSSCSDIKCPFHGSLKVRGRKFQGVVKKKFPKRVVVEFERTIFFRKYERYYKKKTRIHARLPDCLKNEIKIGDYVEIQECRPLSKLIHHVVIKKNKLQSKNKNQENESNIS